MKRMRLEGWRWVLDSKSDNKSDKKVITEYQYWLYKECSKFPGGREGGSGSRPGMRTLSVKRKRQSGRGYGEKRRLTVGGSVTKMETRACGEYETQL